MILASIASDRIEQDEPGMHLVLLQVEAPDARIDKEIDGRRPTRTIRQDIAHLSRVSSLARLRELNLGQQPIALRDKRCSNKHRHWQHQQSLNDRRATHLNGKRRELLEGSWLRYMLIYEGGKAVIGADEEIMAGDVGRMIEGRTMRLHPFGVNSPQMLLSIGQSSPGFQCAVMNSLHSQLRR